MLWMLGWLSGSANRIVEKWHRIWRLFAVESRLFNFRFQLLVLLFFIWFYFWFTLSISFRGGFLFVDLRLTLVFLGRL